MAASDTVIALPVAVSPKLPADVTVSAPPSAPAPTPAATPSGEVPVNADFLILNKRKVAQGGVLDTPIQSRPDIADTSKQDGLNAEMRFQTWAAKAWPGVSIFMACPVDNMQHHWDVFLQTPRAVKAAEGKKDFARGIRGIRVDIKAARRRSRADASVDTTHTWLELQSADETHRGSLFGDAELFAFEQGDKSWLLVPRARLARVVMENAERAGVCLTGDKEEATAEREDKTKPLVVYNRRGAERLLWVSIDAVLRPLAIDPAMPLETLEFAFAAHARVQQKKED